MSSKSKSSFSDTPGNKATPATPRTSISKLSKTPSKLSTDSPSPIQNPRASVERSPRTVTSRSSIINRSSPRAATPPEKSQSRIPKPSELQAQLTAAQDELKKAKEKLLLVEKEKAEALNELEEARKLANDANEKLQESVVAQKQAEESSEVDKFWAVDLGQDGIELVGQKEQEWQNEIQEVRHQHAIDVASLLSTSEELQRVKQELAIVTDTKNQALIHADEATKIAEIHAEKVEILSAELVRLKGEATENVDVMELKLEVGSLKQKLEIAKGLEKILAQKEESFEQLKLELEFIKQELEKAKGIEENLCQKEESVKQLNFELESLKQELENAKSLEEKVSVGEESYEQLKSESDIFMLEKAKGLEENLVQKDQSLQQFKLEFESLKQELVKSKGFEERLSQRKEFYEQVKSESDFLKHELEKAEGFEENLVQKDESLRQLKLELEFLKQEVEKGIGFREKLSQTEESYEQLNIELEASRIAECYARNVLEEWRHKVEESRRLEESLESVMKQLERNGALLHEAECEVKSFKDKVCSLEICLGQQKVDLEESKQNLEKAREEAFAAAKEVVSLKSELETVKEEKAQALENENLATSGVQELLEEKKKLVNELEALRGEEEKSKMAMESLASALHEVSAEAREAKEKLMSSQTEDEGLENEIEDLNQMLKATNEKYESLLDDAKCEINHLTSNIDHSKLEFEYQIEDMKLVVKETNEKYEALLSDSKHEIDQLKDTIEHLKADHQSAKSKWEQKEVQLFNCLKTAEDEKLALSVENERCETMINDTKHDIDDLRKVIEQSNMEYETSKFEWQQKEHELLSCVKLADKTTDENYGTMLDDAKDEIKHLSNMIEKSKVQYENSKLEWEKQQLQFMNAVKRSEEQKSSMEREIMRLVNLLREKEEVARTEMEEGSQLRNTLKEAISEASFLREALEEVKAVESTLKTDLQGRETQLQNLTRENEQLRVAADVNVRKVEELSKLLEEATARKHTLENGDFSGSEKDYDMLPRVVEFSEENGHAHKSEDKHRLENQPQQPEKEASFYKAITNQGKEKGEDSIAGSEPKMWESCKIDEHDFSMEREGEHESVDDELDCKAEAGEGFDQLNGVQSESNRTSPSKEQQQKKKKPLYRKFGSLLKKGIGNQK